MASRIINWLIGLNLLFLAFAFSSKMLSGYFELGLITWSSLFLCLLFAGALYLKKEKPIGRVVFYMLIAIYFLVIFLDGLLQLSAMTLSPLILLAVLGSGLFAMIRKQIRLTNLNVTLLAVSAFILLVSLLFKFLHWPYADFIFIGSFIGFGIWVVYHYFIQSPSS